MADRPASRVADLVWYSLDGGAMMREFWQNVYPPMSCVLTAKAPSRGQSVAWAAVIASYGNMPPVCRIHVRLKPEGAPKRYASEANRLAWEDEPGMCVDAVARGLEPEQCWISYD